MPNPVDDSPVGPGQIALPVDTSDPQPTGTDTASGLRKFRRRALYAVVICLTLGLLVLWEHPAKVGRPVDELAHKPASTSVVADPRIEPYQTPNAAQFCADWVSDVEGHRAFAAFELPTAADLLFFLSRGPVFGRIEIIRDPADSAGTIVVNVTAQYDTLEDLQRTKACRMGSLNEHGVLIWGAPRHPHVAPGRDVRFNITVAIPPGVREYKDLLTDLPLFAHRIGQF